MKYLTMIALAAFALSLGACANRDSGSTTTSTYDSTSSTGYRK